MKNQLSKPKPYTTGVRDKTRYLVDFTFRHNDRSIRLRKGDFLSETEATDWCEKQYYGIKHGFIDPPLKGNKPGRKPKFFEKQLTTKEVFGLVLPEWEKNIRESTIESYC